MFKYMICDFLDNLNIGAGCHFRGRVGVFENVLLTMCRIFSHLSISMSLCILFCCCCWNFWIQTKASQTEKQAMPYTILRQECLRSLPERRKENYHKLFTSLTMLERLGCHNFKFHTLRKGQLKTNLFITCTRTSS